jgi:CheY-like chemotaxis protein
VKDDFAMISVIKNLLARAMRPRVPAPPSEPMGDGRYRNKIMVVDDDPVVLKTLSLTLSSRGYKVVTATDGAQAIGLLRDEGPDMMLVDVSFPVDAYSWDGFYLAQWMRHMNRGLPTIMMSGSYKPGYETRAAAMGAEGFMIKPLDNNLLLGAINKALGTETTMPTLKWVGAE